MESRPYIYLYRTGTELGELNINDKSPNLNYSYIIPSYIKPETGLGNEYEFGFDHVPVGTYVLSYSIDSHIPALFYPVALSHQNAKLIKVELGKRTDIFIKVPFLDQRIIFGRVTLPDGTPVPYVTIRFVDEIEPNAVQWERSFPDGQFSFHVWGDRPFHFYAYYVGIKDGKNIRFFTHTKTMIHNGNMGPLTITLDQIEPN